MKERKKERMKKKQKNDDEVKKWHNFHHIKCLFRCIFPYALLRCIASIKRNKNIKLTDECLVKCAYQDGKVVIKMGAYFNVYQNAP